MLVARKDWLRTWNVRELKVHAEEKEQKLRERGTDEGREARFVLCYSCEADCM